MQIRPAGPIQNMPQQISRPRWAWWWLTCWALITVGGWWSPGAAQGQSNWTIPSMPPVLVNPDFECEVGYTPSTNPAGVATLAPVAWTMVYRFGAPDMQSTRLYYGKVCNRENFPNGAFIERLNLYDSLVIRAQDLETPPEPGKPFDLVGYQQITATVGGVYSLSGWMVSLCGQKYPPYDCPAGATILKAVGLDPLGGTDPGAASVVWTEDRANWVGADGRPVGWRNLSVGVRALSPTVTVFFRMQSETRWHGNMGFVDAFSLVRGPLSDLKPLPARVEGRRVTVEWVGQQSPDVASMAGSTHRLIYDVQVRRVPGGEWRDLVTGTTGTSTEYVAGCPNTAYQFRVRSRSEQPPPPPEGLRPNHRYVGTWSTPQRVLFAAPPVAAPELLPTGPSRVWMPRVVRLSGCQ